METWKYVIHAILLVCAAYGGAQYEKSKYTEMELQQTRTEQNIMNQINNRESVIAKGVFDKLDQLEKNPITNTKSTIIKEPVYIVQCLDEKGIEYLKALKQQSIKVRENE